MPTLESLSQHAWPEAGNKGVKLADSSFSVSEMGHLDTLSFEPTYSLVWGWLIEWQRVLRRNSGPLWPVCFLPNR